MPRLHELSIASNLVKAVVDAASAHPGCVSVGEIEVRVGRAAFISADQLEFCFGIVAKEEPIMEGASLRIVHEEVEISCTGCGRVGPLEVREDPAFHYALPLFACPDCGAAVEMTKGRTVTIANVQLMVEDVE